MNDQFPRENLPNQFSDLKIGMADALLRLHLQVEPTISQHRTCPAKAPVSRKTQSQDPRIKRTSKTNFRSVNGRKLRRVDNSASPIRKLLCCINSGCLDTALQLFDKMTKPNTFVWNVMIRALVASGMFETALELYYRMQIGGIKPDNFTFPFVIKACTGLFNLEEGQKVHSAIIKLGFAADAYICNALIVMYAKGGCIDDSEKTFEYMPVRDVVSWNSMIVGYVSIGDGWSSLMCFREMQECGMEVDRFSYMAALDGCSLVCHSPGGKEIFCQVLRNGLELDSMIQSSLIDMFGKCGQVDLAEKLCWRILERNVVVWNAMIGAYVLNDQTFESLACLKKMQWDDNVAPDAITFINLLPACSKVKALLFGKAIHGCVIRKGHLSHLVLETALVDMYGKCRDVALAERVFHSMNERNLVSWNAMIAAYVQNSNNREAVKMFQVLLHESCVPDEWTFASVLAAYAEIALPKEGKQVHCFVTKLGISSGTLILNSMIHMYAKCGDLESSEKVFNTMLFKDVVTWNTIIMAYAIHGFGEYCFRLFVDMVNEGNKPNGSTFVSLLSGCSIAGFVDEGWKYFDSMKKDHGIELGIEHYGCMLDLLGRAGELDCAKQLIEEMPLMPTHRIWGSLLAASRHHRNVEMAEMAVSHIFSLQNKNNMGSYVLLSNLYAEVGRWEDVKRVRSLMKGCGSERTAGCSLVEYNGKTYEFTNHDRSKTERNIFYDVLDILSKRIGEENANVHSATKLRPMDILKRRDNHPTCHSVRLAICAGLIGTTVGKPVLVRKNVRICADCHVAAEKISEVSNREIIVGDSKMYHHFRNGRCSCGDYW